MPSPNNKGVGTYSTVADTQGVPDSTYDPATTVETGQVVDTTPADSNATPSPLASLASGIGGVLLFPGRVIVQQFVGASGDPLDMSHMPVTILLSAAAWYGLYWYLTRPGGVLHSRASRATRRFTKKDAGDDE